MRLSIVRRPLLCVTNQISRLDYSQSVGRQFGLISFQGYTVSYCLSLAISDLTEINKEISSLSGKGRTRNPVSSYMLRNGGKSKTLYEN